ncbi:MAG: four helix bundle protein, partial [Candidatus Latescibacteria bacterium]|nr:four helix bundle protein [Candidatus Latescibacterota bacterium]
MMLHAIPHNLAEGDELQTARPAIKFFCVATCSFSEARAQSIIAFDVGVISKKPASYVHRERRRISRLVRKNASRTWGSASPNHGCHKAGHRDTKIQMQQ